MAANLEAVFQSGKIAVITGSSSGIGLGMARRCAAAGMTVYLLDYDSAALAVAQKELAGSHGIVTDVSQREQLEKARDQVLASHSTIHFVFANAGTGEGANALGDTKAWDTTIGTNMWGIINTCQTFVPVMLAGNQPGIVINTG